MNIALRADRRQDQRHYLMKVVKADLVFGHQRIKVETGRIGDISDKGLGVHPLGPLDIKPATPITIAVRHDESVLSISGEVASVHYGHLGIRVDQRQQSALPKLIEAYQERIVVSPPLNGLSHVKGTVSMFARFPMQWAVTLGATHFDLSQVKQIDSSGVGLLLMLSDRHGIKLLNCSDKICQLIELCKVPALCGACRA